MDTVYSVQHNVANSQDNLALTLLLWRLLDNVDIVYTNIAITQDSVAMVLKNVDIVQ